MITATPCLLTYHHDPGVSDQSCLLKAPPADYAKALGCGLRALATRATHSHRTVAERAAFGSALGQLSPCRDAIGQLGKGGPGQQLIVLLTEQMRRHRVQPGVAA